MEKNDNDNNNNEQNDNSMSKVKKKLLRQHTEVHSVAIYGAENAENRQQSELQPVKEWGSRRAAADKERQMHYIVRLSGLGSSLGCVQHRQWRCN